MNKTLKANSKKPIINSFLLLIVLLAITLITVPSQDNKIYHSENNLKIDSKISEYEAYYFSSLIGVELYAESMRSWYIAALGTEEEKNNLGFGYFTSKYELPNLLEKATNNIHGKINLFLILTFFAFIFGWIWLFVANFLIIRQDKLTQYRIENNHYKATRGTIFIVLLSGSGIFAALLTPVYVSEGAFLSWVYSLPLLTGYILLWKTYKSQKKSNKLINNLSCIK